MADDSDYLRRLNRNQGIANAAAAANLVQQRALISEVRQLNSAVEASRSEERAYRFAMWLQSPDGQAYAIWRRSALELVEELARRDSLWRTAWQDEVDSTISAREISAVAADQYTDMPIPVMLQNRFGGVTAVVVLVAVVALYGAWESGPFWLFAASTVVLSAASGVLVWMLLFRDFDYLAREADTSSRLRKRRLEHFGVDPIDGRGLMPSWSRDNAHVAQFAAIKRILIAADVEFPTASQLPLIELPPLVDPQTVALASHRAMLLNGFGSDTYPSE